MFCFDEISNVLVIGFRVTAFDSVDFFNRYYRKGWESPRDVKSGYYDGKINGKYNTNVGSVQMTKIGYRPFKLSLEKFPRRYHNSGTDLNSWPVTKGNSDKNLDSVIPDFLKFAIPMEKIVPSSIISQRRMDIVLPGYSRTRSYNIQHRDEVKSGRTITH